MPALSKGGSRELLATADRGPDASLPAPPALPAAPRAAANNIVGPRAQDPPNNNTSRPREPETLVTSQPTQPRKAPKRPAAWTMNDAERPLERALFASTREDMEARLGQYNTELTGALQASSSRAEKEIRH